MGLKKSSINLSGILAPNWVTQLGSASLAFVGTGTHIMVPGPPAGKLRTLSKFPASPVIAQVTLVASDGTPTTPVGDFDFSPQLNSTQISQTLTGQSTPILPGSTTPSIIIQPGEDYTINISAFNGGANRAVGFASWADFDFTPNISVLRFPFPDDSPITFIPTVPAGKTANIYGPPTLIAGSTGASVFNADSVVHNFLVEVVVGSIGVGINSFVVNNGEAIGFTFQSIPAGTSMRITMQESVTTTAPRFYGAYSLLDV